MFKFLLFLSKKRIPILVNFLIVTVIAFAVVLFMIKKEYSAQITFLPPVNESSLSSSFIDMSLSKLLMNSDQSVDDQIAAIFASKAAKRNIINKYNLYKSYKLEKNKNKFENAVRRMRKYVQLVANEKGSMGFQKTVSFTLLCYHTSPDTAKEMVDYTFSILDSAVRKISIEKANRNRIFVQEQLTINRIKLDSLQTIFKEFQTEHKAYDIPEQLKLSLQTYADIKATSLMNDFKLQSLRNEFRGSTPEIAELKKQARIYNDRLAQFEKSQSPEVLLGFDFSSKILPEYTNLLREIEVQNQVILLLTREYEQAKLQESRDVSSLVVIDPSYIPEYKSRPRRLVILLSIILLENLFLFILLGYRFYYKEVLKRNPLFIRFVNDIKNRDETLV